MNKTKMILNQLTALIIKDCIKRSVPVEHSVVEIADMLLDGSWRKTLNLSGDVARLAEAMSKNLPVTIVKEDPKKTTKKSIKKVKKSAAKKTTKKKKKPE